MDKLGFPVLFITLCFNCIVLNAEEVYVSPNGEVSAEGSMESPVSLREAIDRVAGLLKSDNRSGAISVLLKGGVYRFDRAMELADGFSGTFESPVAIRAIEGEEVVFDGGMGIGIDGFSKVVREEERALLAASARDRILAKTIEDPAVIEKLGSRIIQTLTFDGKSYLPSKFPNTDYAILDWDVAGREVTPPAVPKFKHSLRAGNPPFQEDGKPQGWRGSTEEPRGARVGFSKYENGMAGSWEQWEHELGKTNRRNLFKGFVCAAWLLNSQEIYAANAADRTIHLSKALSYGWDHIEDKEFRVFGLLCELDQPGEWHFDVTTNRLYIFPPSKVTPDTRISLPLANGFIDLNKASHVSIVGITVQNVGNGVVIDMGEGSRNLLADCVIARSTATGVRIDGSYCKIQSCDFTDLDFHLLMRGGVLSPTEITAGVNVVENCHFYQKGFRHEKVNIDFGGVGNVFRRNLVHNSIGQAMIVRGNDQLLELNEFFNIGFEEGDGGAVYSGANLAGYGNVYRHNFFHHLMDVPGKIERAGIHLDDLQAGATCYGNVFYKSASKGLFMFGGAGHVLYDNVNLEGRKGIYNVSGTLSISNYKRQEEILRDPDHDYVNVKENYIGNTEKIVGREGWNKDPWKTKYPRMQQVMNDTGMYGRMWPIRCVVENNLFYGNGDGDHTIWSRFEPEARAKSIIKGDRKIGPEYFVDYENMDFRFKNGLLDVPAIPFDEIGLRIDDYRTSIPDKAYYRSSIRKHFEGITSYGGTNVQIDTAKLIEEGPMLGE